MDEALLHDDRDFDATRVDAFPQGPEAVKVKVCFYLWLFPVADPVYVARPVILDEHCPVGHDQ